MRGDGLQQGYEELAERYQQLGEPRRRDHCLVLAADAALAAGQLDEAERLRQRLLQVNPYHLLRPYTSMSEALQSNDVRDYVADLRNQLPAEMVAQLLQQAPPAEQPVYKLISEPRPPTPAEVTPLPEVPPPPRVVAPAPAPRKPVSPPMPPAPPRIAASPFALPEEVVAHPSERATPTGRWVAILLFLVGLVLCAGMFFIAFMYPFFH